MSSKNGHDPSVWALAESAFWRAHSGCYVQKEYFDAEVARIYAALKARICAQLEAEGLKWGQVKFSTTPPNASARPVVRLTEAV